MSHTIKTTVKTTSQHEIRVSRHQLVQMLQRDGLDVVPDDAAVTVRVPGGGDYSNTDLDIDQDTDIKITWQEKT